MKEKTLPQLISELSWNNLPNELKQIFKKISIGTRTFTSLDDTPINYTGQGGKVVKVNNLENGLEFANENTGSSGIQDAPNDGRFYLRQNGSWVLATLDNILLTGSQSDQSITLADVEGNSNTITADTINMVRNGGISTEIQGNSVILNNGNGGVTLSSNNSEEQVIYNFPAQTELNVNVAIE